MVIINRMQINYKIATLTNIFFVSVAFFLEKYANFNDLVNIVLLVIILIMIVPLLSCGMLMLMDKFLGKSHPLFILSLTSYLCAVLGLYCYLMGLMDSFLQILPFYIFVSILMISLVSFSFNLVGSFIVKRPIPQMLRRSKRDISIHTSSTFSESLGKKKLVELDRLLVILYESGYENISLSSHLSYMFFLESVLENNNKWKLGEPEIDKVSFIKILFLSIAYQKSIKMRPTTKCRLSRNN